MGVHASKPHPVATKWFPDFEKELPMLNGKTVAITGTTSGTGYIVARTAVQKGADHVLLLNRPSDRATKAEESLKAEIKQGSKTKIESIPCDLQDFESVKSAAATIKAKYQAIDVLCNNAGVMALEDKATKDGYDVQMQTNHLSHFLLTKELYPLLKRAKDLRGEARVIHHSSGARFGAPLKSEFFGKNGGNLGGNGNSMFFGGGRWERYHQSKLANTTFTMALKERFADSGIKAAVAAPGLAATNLQTTSNSDGGMTGNMWIMRFSQSAEDGTMPILAACFDPTTENGDLWEPGNYTRMWGPPAKFKHDSNSLDVEAQKMLREMSEQACGKFEVN